MNEAKELLILRHAKSDWSNKSLADHERPLNARGQRAAMEIGRFLRHNDKVPDLVLCSSSRRTLETLERLDLPERKPAASGPEIRILDELYHASLDQWLAQTQLALAEAQRLLVIGHEPTCSAALFHLTGANSRFPTAALACVRCAQIPGRARVNLRHGGQTLLWLILPRLLEAS